MFQNVLSPFRRTKIRSIRANLYLWWFFWLKFLKTWIWYFPRAPFIAMASHEEAILVRNTWFSEDGFPGDWKIPRSFDQLSIYSLNHWSLGWFYLFRGDFFFSFSFKFYCLVLISAILCPLFGLIFWVFQKSEFLKITFLENSTFQNRFLCFFFIFRF